MVHPVTHAGLIVAIAALLVAGGCSSTHAPPGPSAADVQPSSTTAQVDLGATAPNEQVQFEVSLTMPGRAGLETYLAGLTMPGSVSYRQFLTPDQFGARFGLPQANVDAVAHWLSGAGLSADAAPQRTSISASGTADAVSKLLGVNLVDRQTEAGVRYHVPIGEPVVPANLRSSIAVILGLDSEPVQRPMWDGRYMSGVGKPGITPAVASRAYEIDPLHDAGFHGEGQSIAIVSFDTFTDDEVAFFDQQAGITGAPAVERVALPGSLDTPGSEAPEVALDIEVIRGIAPKARIINYEGPNNSSGLVPIVKQIVKDGKVKIVSDSWGYCENHSNPLGMAAEEQELAAAWSAGISFFSASGDDAAFDCRRVQISDKPFDRDVSPSVDWPSASTHVISVGGTFLSVLEDGTYFDEAGWEDPLGGSGAGGGLSKYQTRPPWQQGTGVNNSQSNGMRQVPDVAGPADPASGFMVVYTTDDGLVRDQVGGTSAASPFWAASMLLTQQVAQNEGVAALVPLGPVLYGVAAAHPEVFHDIIRGGNLLFDAAPGWDYATGLGSPRVAQLARAIVDYVKANGPQN